MRARWLPVLLAVPLFAAHGQGLPATSSVASVDVHPDTVTVGEPFTIAVRVRAPLGSTIAFPDGPDSAAAVQPLDPRVLGDGSATDAVVRTATYRVAAWNVGALPIGLPDILVRVGAAVQRVSLIGPTVFVRSVLPADSAARVPKPARDLLVGWPIPWWILGVLALIAALLWWSRRRARRRQTRRRRQFRRSTGRNANSRAWPRWRWSRPGSGGATWR